MEKLKGSVKKTIKFGYDPQGRRVAKEAIIVQDGVTKTEMHRYIYDYDNTIVEAVTDGMGTTKTFFTHGSDVDEHLTMERNGQVSYYHPDGLGSVVALTDQKKKVVQSYVYDSFGNVKASSDSLVNACAYTGRELDKETGLYYYRARYYDPMDGRFISKDPVGFNGGFNLYGYVDNNSINRKDPTGLKPGQWYDSADKAALEATKDFIMVSNDFDREFGGFIYRNDKTCKYSYTYAMPGQSREMDVSKFYLPPSGNTIEAIYHIHPGKDYNDVHNFSGKDRSVTWPKSIGGMNIGIYMGNYFETRYMDAWNGERQVK